MLSFGNQIFIKHFTTCLLLFCTVFLSAQNTTENTILDIHEKTYNAESKILDLILVISNNNANENFKGKIKISTSCGIQIYSGSEYCY